MNLRHIFKLSSWGKVVTATTLLAVMSGCTMSSGQLAGASSSNPIEGDIFLPIITNLENNATNTVTDTTTVLTETLPSEVLTDTVAAVVTNTVGYSSEPIPGQYIVVFKDDLVMASSVSAVSAEMAAQYGGEVVQNYDASIVGFTAQFPVERSADAVAGLQQDDRVAYVEQDATISLNPTVDTVSEATGTAVGTEVSASGTNASQSGPPWGLDRIDQRLLPLNGSYNYVATGAGVQAYIIDTGIAINHTQFTGRILPGYTSVGGTAADCHGHGTHVAGTVGGSTYGVAKQVKLVPVRVLDCLGRGTASSVIAGINWVTQQKRNNLSIPMVANMSLGGARNTSIDSAVTASINAGVIYVVAAGNETTDACTRSPAATPLAITVGATSNNDARASFSNYGSCLDIFAPGVNILSAWHTSASATNTISGTSMATPHVAGVIALILQSRGNISPPVVTTTLRSLATPNRVINAVSPYNYLLFFQ